MKLRIKGNTIRFRLTQKEIESVSSGFVEDRTHFPGANVLSYKIQSGLSFNAEFSSKEVCITVPSEIINDWISTDEVSIQSLVELDDGNKLEISLEKDFKCLTGRPKEDETDMFPNPLEKHSKC